MTDNIQDQLFQDLYDAISKQQLLLASIADRLNRIESLGGGGNGTASIEDYQSNQHYTRNMLLVDTDTETVYRVVTLEYTSKTVEEDCQDGNLKLVGFESQIVAFNGNPTQSQINVLPDDTLVAIYSAADAPYVPDALE